MIQLFDKLKNMKKQMTNIYICLFFVIVITILNYILILS